jgi:hypothetical protein
VTRGDLAAALAAVVALSLGGVAISAGTGGGAAVHPKALAACADARLRSCLARVARPTWSHDDLRAYFAAGDDGCFAARRADPHGRRLEQQARCLPLSVGVDARTGKALELRYFCSDVCPGQGAVFLIYAGVDRDACCALAGRPLHDPAWGAYRGCLPPEATSPAPQRHGCEPPPAAKPADAGAPRPGP